MKVKQMPGIFKCPTEWCYFHRLPKEHLIWFFELLHLKAETMNVIGYGTCWQRHHRKWQSRKRNDCRESFCLATIFLEPLRSKQQKNYEVTIRETVDTELIMLSQSNCLKILWETDDILLSEDPKIYIPTLPITHVPMTSLMLYII